MSAGRTFSLKLLAEVSPLLNHLPREASDCWTFWRAYLELHLVSWGVLYIVGKLRKISTTFMFSSRADSSHKMLKNQNLLLQRIGFSDFWPLNLLQPISWAVDLGIERFQSELKANIQGYIKQKSSKANSTIWSVKIKAEGWRRWFQNSSTWQQTSKGHNFLISSPNCTKLGPTFSFLAGLYFKCVII